MRPPHHDSFHPSSQDYKASVSRRMHSPSVPSSRDGLYLVLQAAAPHFCYTSCPYSPLSFVSKPPWRSGSSSLCPPCLQRHADCPKAADGQLHCERPEGTHAPDPVLRLRGLSNERRPGRFSEAYARSEWYDIIIYQIAGSLTLFLGMFPGPTIEVNQGDRLVVNVTNHLNTRTYVLHRK